MKKTEEISLQQLAAQLRNEQQRVVAERINRLGQTLQRVIEADLATIGIDELTNIKVENRLFLATTETINGQLRRDKHFVAMQKELDALGITITAVITADYRPIVVTKNPAERRYQIVINSKLTMTRDSSEHSQTILQAVYVLDSESLSSSSNPLKFGQHWQGFLDDVKQYLTSSESESWWFTTTDMSAEFAQSTPAKNALFLATQFVLFSEQLQYNYLTELAKRLPEYPQLILLQEFNTPLSIVVSTNHSTSQPTGLGQIMARVWKNEPPSKSQRRIILLKEGDTQQNRLVLARITFEELWNYVQQSSSVEEVISRIIAEFARQLSPPTLTPWRETVLASAKKMLPSKPSSLR